MADQSFDVMISNIQYNELKQLKKKYLELEDANKQANIKLRTIQKEVQCLQLKDKSQIMEINYLVKLIQTLYLEQSNQKPSGLQAMKSTTFQILGQSVFEPQHTAERQKYDQNLALTKKYHQLLEKTFDFKKYISSKEETIFSLNQLINEKNQVIVRLEQQNEKQREKEKIGIEKPQMKNSGVVKSVKEDNSIHIIALQREVMNLTEKLSLKEVEFEKHLQEQEAKYKAEVKQIKGEMAKVRDENKKMVGLLKDFSDRTKGLQKEIESLKKNKTNNTGPKVETIIRIKALVDEHVREVESNLKTIEGLSAAEIKNLVQLQMKELIEYISKSIENKN